MSVHFNLLDALALEPIEVNLFRGQTPAEERDRGRIFGGQVIAQALMAAYRTVEGRLCHSLQAYFIRPGDPKIPVLYEVERSRDGKSFTTRRVIAIQHGEQIFNLAASFQIEEQGFEHAAAMPPTPPPEATPNDAERAAALPADAPPGFREMMARDMGIELRRMEPVDLLRPAPAPPNQKVWFRAHADVGEDPIANQIVLAFATDMTLLGTAARPHGETWLTGLQMASLDHVLWFHRPSRMREWHLFDQDSPSASGARGFNRGAIYSADGTLVASVAQEGLIRLRR